MRIITSIDHRLAYWTGSDWSFVPQSAAVFASMDAAMSLIMSRSRMGGTWAMAHVVQ